VHDAAALHDDAFGTQATGLLGACTRAFGKYDALAGAQNPMPRQFQIRRRSLEHAPDEPGAPRQSGKARHSAIRGNFASRDAPHCPTDGCELLWIHALSEVPRSTAVSISHSRRPGAVAKRLGDTALQRLAPA